MFKFDVGQKVIFNQGEAAVDVGSPEEVTAVICARHDEKGTIIYQIEYLPKSKGGSAMVLEEELNSARQTQGQACDIGESSGL